MNTIMQISLGYCTAFVFMGAVFMICPGGNMKKSVSYLSGVALILILILPLGRLHGIEPEFSLSDTDINKNTVEMSAAAAEYLCCAALDGEKINYKKVTVNTDISEDGSISITKVTVISNEDRTKIASALSEIAPEKSVEINNE